MAAAPAAPLAPLARPAPHPEPLLATETPDFKDDARRRVPDGFIPEEAWNNERFEIVGPGTDGSRAFVCQAAAFEYAHTRFRELGGAWLAAGGVAGAGEAAAAPGGEGAEAPPAHRHIEARRVDLSWIVKPGAAKKCGSSLRSHLEKRLRVALASLFDVDESEKLGTDVEQERRYLIVAAIQRLVAPIPPASGFTVDAVAEGSLAGDFFRPTEFVVNCGDDSWLVRATLDSVAALHPQREQLGPRGGGGGWRADLLGDVRATVTAHIVKATGFALSMPAERGAAQSLAASFAQMRLF